MNYKIAIHHIYGATHCDLITTLSKQFISNSLVQNSFLTKSFQLHDICNYISIEIF
jgi:hypothetical protein